VAVAASRAVLTIVKNEPIFLPIFLRYYGQFFAADDSHVLDHGTTDGSTDIGGFTREPVDHPFVDHSWMRDTVQARQHELLESYEYVLFCDVDEIIAPNPTKYDGLGDYIDRMTADYVNCRGVEVLHQKDTEPPIDLDRPVLDQRGWWFRNYIYSKPLLSRVPLHWVPGFHHRDDGTSNQDLDLLLIHLHRMDYELCWARHHFRNALEWNDSDIYLRSGYQNRIVADTEFEHWFYNDTANVIPLVPRKIPRHWRGVV
jgi:Glycosyl transferase family 2